MIWLYTVHLTGEPIRFLGSSHLPDTMCTWHEEEKLTESMASLGFEVLFLDTLPLPRTLSAHIWKKPVHSTLSLNFFLSTGFVGLTLVSYGFVTHCVPSQGPGSNTEGSSYLENLEGFYIRDDMDIETKWKGKATVGSGKTRRWEGRELAPMNMYKSPIWKPATS